MSRPAPTAPRTVRVAIRLPIRIRANLSHWPLIKRSAGEACFPGDAPAPASREIGQRGVARLRLEDCSGQPAQRYSGDVGGNVRLVLEGYEPWNRGAQLSGSQFHAATRIGPALRGKEKSVRPGSRCAGGGNPEN